LSSHGGILVRRRVHFKAGFQLWLCNFLGPNKDEQHTEEGAKEKKKELGFCGFEVQRGTGLAIYLS
jgi:hypothetical protein